MEDYTDELREAPAMWLKALSICLDGQWMEQGDRIGFSTSHDGVATDVEFDRAYDTLFVATDGIHTVEWEAPLSHCRLVQKVDDSQLFTELTANTVPGSGTASNSLSVWGPRARYRGGVLKTEEPDVDESQFILARIVDHV
jgi:hypothetical protein